MKKRKMFPVLAFDPGSTTGFAVLNREGEMLLTSAVSPEALDHLLEFLSLLKRGRYETVIEIGPQYEHHSPITRKVEAKLRVTFPDAYLIQPSQWKGHPTTRFSLPRNMTPHERDAVRLGRWFQRRENDEVTARTDTVST